MKSRKRLASEMFDTFDTFATQSVLVHDFTDTDCRQHSLSCFCDFQKSILTNETKNSMKNCCELVKNSIRIDSYRDAAVVGFRNITPFIFFLLQFSFVLFHSFFKLYISLFNQILDHRAKAQIQVIFSTMSIKIIKCLHFSGQSSHKNSKKQFVEDI